MKKLTTTIVLVCLMLIGAPKAHASFVVDWGNSWDSPYGPGYAFLGNWLKNQGYFSTLAAANTYVQTGYIGHDASDPDPFYFVGGQYKIDIIGEIAGYANLNTMGYYTNSGMVQIFSGPDNSSTPQKTFTTADDFGLYFDSNYNNGTYWYTDRFKNTAQTGVLSRRLGPQGLIYELEPDTWLVTWEDLDSSRSQRIGCSNNRNYSDNDYNDMLVIMQKCNTPVPEPASIVLFGLGALGLLRKRKRHEKV
jgi:hypothetical protein